YIRHAWPLQRYAESSRRITHNQPARGNSGRLTNFLEGPMEVSIWIFLLLSVLKVAVVTVILLTAVAYTVLLERKVVGRIQNRWGPSRVGPFGLLQPERAYTAGSPAVLDAAYNLALQQHCISDCRQQDHRDYGDLQHAQQQKDPDTDFHRAFQKIC